MDRPSLVYTSETPLSLRCLSRTALTRHSHSSLLLVLLKPRATCMQHTEEFQPCLSGQTGSSYTALTWHFCGVQPALSWAIRSLSSLMCFGLSQAHLLCHMTTWLCHNFSSYCCDITVQIDCYLSVSIPGPSHRPSFDHLQYPKTEGKDLIHFTMWITPVSS